MPKRTPKPTLVLLATLCMTACSVASDGGSDPADAAESPLDAEPARRDASTGGTDGDAEAPVPERDAEVVVVPERDAEVVVVPERDAEVVVVPERDAEVVVVPEWDAEVVVVPERDAEVVVVPDAAIVIVPEPDAAVVDVPEPDAEVVVVPEPLPDLEILPDRTLGDLWFEERDFAADSCAVFEGCVTAPGRRRLLRFGVTTANVGEADMVMGRPEENAELFEFSACHGHYHFNDYAQYALRGPNDELIAPGHKQAFCLLDSGRFLEDDPDVRREGRYNCGFQGISRGWFDAYGSYLDCQWIDITDVAPGAYELEVRINPARVILESNFDNNDTRLPVRIPSFELDTPCAPDEPQGPERSCGWTLGAVGRCAPGELVDAACAGVDVCDDAACPEDALLRACDGDAASCFDRNALARGNDECGRCPALGFSCPESGVYTLWTGALDPARPALCEPTVRVRPEPPVDTACEVFDRAEGPDRRCGWGAPKTVDCAPGGDYTVGCTAAGCGAGEVCEGDPMLLICPGASVCTQTLRLGANDDACGGLCPALDFTCPPEGQVTLVTGAYRDGQAFQCEPGLIPRF
jgi:hypothetical protein